MESYANYISNHKKTAMVVLKSVKDSDGWFELTHNLGHKQSKCYEMFEHGEYADIKIIVDENFNIVGGEIIPSGRK